MADGSQARPGYRLKRLEMLNWGTFSGKVAMLEPELGWTLLVGQNGSGKSTAVDALRTLLVPPQLLKYNDASGEQRRRDRTRRSYVRGTYATVTQEDSGLPMAQNIRTPGELSVLLGVFVNEVYGRTVTLVQVLWEANEEIRQVYAVARSEKSIAANLADLGQSRDLRKTLTRRGFDHVSDSFSAYAEYFRSQLAIPNQAALEVFNQAIGLKDIPDINRFIRDHMLEGSDVLEFLRDEVQPHFRELDECWAIIQRAEKQLHALEPIVRGWGRMSEALTRKAELERMTDAAPFYYAGRHLDLRHHEAQDLAQEIAEAGQRKLELDAVRARDEQERDAKQRELGANSTQQSIHRIVSQLQSTGERLDGRKRRRGEMERSLQAFGRRTIPESEQEFAVLRTEVLGEQEELQVLLAGADEEKVRLRVELAQTAEERKRLAGELETVEKN
ncbi:MAG: AAA family ATPase, partial [Gemmatimonadetes bacterium]|nr:AAA family ATPase [Gemmatimonadota bacterium]